MYSLHIKKRLSDLLALAALLLFIGLEVAGCKDMEDCRSLYYTSQVYIAFKGTKSFSIDHIDVQESTGTRTLITSINIKSEFFTPTLPLDQQVVKFFVYKTPTDPQPDTITLHYQVKYSLLSPDCGIQEIYVITRVETSFESSTIVAPEAKITDPVTAGNQKPHVEISY